MYVSTVRCHILDTCYIILTTIHMQSTIQIFRHLYEHLPPLFSDESAKKMAHALEHLERDQTVTLTEVEDTMIKFGYELWPWNQAYREFLAIAENQIGEHALLPKLSKGLQARYHDFKRYGGTLRDLHSGRPADFFTSEDRGELCTALVDMQKDLREYVEHSLIGLEKTRYLRRVNEFKELLAQITMHLTTLNDLADREQDHPTLADEIRARVKSFEYGLCLLGPELNYEAVCQSLDFFRGRRHDLGRMRGIHTAVGFDYSN